MANIHTYFFSIFMALLCLYSPVACAKNINDYLEKAPWIGLIANEITYGPLKISKVHIHDGNKLVFAEKGQILHGSLHYKIKAEDLKTLHRHHLIIGVKGDGPQDCVTHSMGVLDSNGTGEFKLTAPDKKGIYQVRFLLAEGVTCATAREQWNTAKQTPSSAATIGVIIVE